MNNFICTSCGSKMTGEFQPGDFCPNCQDGALLPADPIVFEHYREFKDLLQQYPKATKNATVTIQTGVKPDGTEVLMIAGTRLRIHRQTTDGWQPYILDGTEVFNIRRVF